MRHVSELPLSIPESAASAELVRFGSAGSLGIRVYHIHGPVSEGPALLFGHANGFAAGSYLPWLQRIAQHMRVFAYDMRGHGASERVPEPLAENAHVDAHARDLSTVAVHLLSTLGKEVPVHFAAHSMSGLAALRLGAVQDMGLWQSVCLFEPPLSPTPDMPEHAVSAGLAGGLIRSAERRRREWDSPDAFFNRLDSNPHYANWDRDMMRAHCAATLHKREDGTGYELACDPEAEAANYRATLNSSTFRFVDRFAFTTTFVASDPPGEDGPPSWAARMQQLAAERVPGAKHVHLKGASHMMLFERPDECLEVLQAHLAAAGTTVGPFVAPSQFGPSE